MKKRKPLSPEELVAESLEDAARMSRELGVDLTVETLAGPTLASRAHSVTLAHTAAAIESMEDVIERLVEERVRRIMEEEGVAIIISGKLKKYSMEKISISKLDPRPEEVAIEPEIKKDGTNFLEELNKLR